MNQEKNSPIIHEIESAINFHINSKENQIRNYQNIEENEYLDSEKNLMPPENVNEIKIIKVPKIITLDPVNSTETEYSAIIIILKEKLPQLLTALLGTFLTFAVWTQAKLNNFIVKNTFALIYSLLVPKYSDIFFGCGLAGLSNPLVFYNVGFSFLCGCFFFIYYNLGKNLFVGYSGKLGIIAYLSNFCNCVVIYLISLSNVYDYQIPWININYYKVLDSYIFIFGPIFSCISAGTAYIVLEYILVTEERITAVSMSALCYGLILQTFTTPLMISAEYFPRNYGDIFTIFIDVGILATLAKADIFQNFNYLNDYNLHHYMIIGFLGGWIHIASFPLLFFGGKPGFSAFIACNIYLLFLKFVYLIKEQFYPIDSNPSQKPTI